MKMSIILNDGDYIVVSENTPESIQEFIGHMQDNGGSNIPGSPTGAMMTARHIIFTKRRWPRGNRMFLSNGPQYAHLRVNKVTLPSVGEAAKSSGGGSYKSTLEEVRDRINEVLAG